MDHFVRSRMRAMHIHKRGGTFLDAKSPPWRKFPKEVPESGVHVRLIERDPVSAHVSKFVLNLVTEYLETTNRLARQKGSRTFKPLRVREMVERDERT